MAASKSKAEKREDRRRRERARDTGDGPTFEEALAAGGLLEVTSRATRSIIERAEAVIRESARTQLSVISCDNCTATKSCCTLRTTAWLHEGVPIAARLRREGRDTPALREALRESARLMDTLPPASYARPCVFLDADERCTVYADRPSVCGTTFVATPPELCNTRGAQVRKYVHPLGEASATAQALFEQQLGLPPVPGTYLRPLPRVVLLCLEAWDRRDFASYLTSKLTATAVG